MTVIRLQTSGGTEPGDQFLYASTPMFYKENILIKKED